MKSTFFYILIRSWNAFAYFDRCIESVLNQNYSDYKILFVDDASDYTRSQKNHIRQKLQNHIVRFNTIRKYSVRNAYEMIQEYAVKPEAVVVNLDGDDWFYETDGLQYLAKIYRKDKVWLTYGECFLWDGRSISTIPARLFLQHTNREYSVESILGQKYRNEPFLPLHPRSFKAWLFKRIKARDLKMPDNSWIRFAEDQAMFYPMLEMAAGKYKSITKPLCVYNRASEIANLALQPQDFIIEELVIRKKPSYEPLSP